MSIEVTSVHEKARVIKSVGRIVRLGARAARAHKRRIIFRSTLAAIILTLTSVSIFLAYSYHYYSKIVDERLARGYLTSRQGIYAAPRRLRVGQSGSPEKLVALLRRAGYVESEASDVWSGSFAAQGDEVVIHPRRLNDSVPAIVRVSFDSKNRIATLTSDAGTLDQFTLEPEALTVDASMKAGQRAALSFQDIPPVIAHAILSTEDRRFFEHSGVDLVGIARAALRNAGDERMGQGGSTITQQLVKNTYLSPERTFKRKFAEAMLAFTLEQRLSKQDIFALYCNEVYLGERGSVAVRGIEQAARIYFAKNLSDLSVAEAATIAGMIQSPNRYSPERHADAATARRNLVIASMLRDGAITIEEAQAAARSSLTLAPQSEENRSLAPYFVDYVNRVTESQPDNSNQSVESASRVFTTLDLDLQELAEEAIKHQLEKLDRVYKGRGMTPQAALVALDPKTGDVLAMVGGRDYAESQLNRATDARRQPGSAFKPFVYAAAIESGISPVTTFTDAPRAFAYDAHSVYSPANYGGGYSMRDVTMRTGLIKSLNVVTVDIALRTGLNKIATLASSFGLPKPQAYPSLALGTMEATPLEMAEAYAAFANGGERVAPRVTAHAVDTNHSEILNEEAQADAVIQPTTAFMITDMLAGVIDHGTARAARNTMKRTAIAGKTGTSRDGWFVGYTPNLVCAVWIGFDDNSQLGLTGAEAALPAWTEFVKSAVELRPELGGERFERPAGIMFVEIDPETGMLATDACPQRERIAITGALAPHFECYVHNQSLAGTAEAGTEDGGTVNSYQVYESASAIPSELRARPITRASNMAESIEPPPLRSTRVEIDRNGRATLVNDMRANHQKNSSGKLRVSP